MTKKEVAKGIEMWERDWAKGRVRKVKRCGSLEEINEKFLTRGTYSLPEPAVSGHKRLVDRESGTILAYGEVAPL